MTINAIRIKLATTSYSENYGSNLAWATIQTTLKSKVEFVESDDPTNNVTQSVASYSVVGMHNGLYGYGSPGVDDLQMSPTTHIVGSTYAVIVEVNNANYELEGDNYFIFKYQTAKIGSTHYTIEDAIAQSGTITFAGNLATSTNPDTYVATSFCNLTTEQGYPYTSTTFNLIGRTLIVPYENSLTEYVLNTNGTSKGYVYSALVIPSSVTINVDGTSAIVTAASIDVAQPKLTVVCNRGVIMNYGTINVASGGNVRSYGFIKGNGYINLNSGSVAIDCLATYDWVGGSAALNIYEDVFPTNSWSLHNISCYAKVYAGASYKGFVYAVVSGQQAEATPNIIGTKGTSNCMFKPSESSSSEDYVLKYAKPANSWGKSDDGYKALYSISGYNQFAGQKDIIEIHGDYEDAELKISLEARIAGLLPITVEFSSSKTKSASAGYMDVVIVTGSNLKLGASDYVFMPGTKLTIQEGASVEIDKDVDLALLRYSDIANYTETLGGFNGVHKSNNESSRCIDKDDAEIIVNGSLTVNGNISGLISTSSSTGTLIINGSNKANYTTLTSSASPYFYTGSTTARGPMKTSGEPVVRTISKGTFYSDGSAWYQNTCHLVYDVNGGNETIADSGSRTVNANGGTH